MSTKGVLRPHSALPKGSGMKTTSSAPGSRRSASIFEVQDENSRFLRFTQRPERFPARCSILPQPSCYRVRVDRVWHDLDGKPAFLTPAQIVNMAVMMTLGNFEPEPLPDIPRGTRVSHQTAPADGDMPERRETGWTMTEPIRAQDGLAYVGVSVYGRGVVMLPVNSLSIIGRTS